MNNFKKTLGGLVAIPQWFVWRMVWNEGKGKYDPKTPVSASGYNVDAQVSTSWMTFDVAVAQRNAQRMRETKDGVVYTLGFMFTTDCGYWFYDLDKCVAGGNLNEFTAGQYAHLHKCFFEYSSSGTGVHFIGANVDRVKADRTRPLAGFGADIEFYTQGRGIAFGLSDEAFGCADEPAPQEWMRWLVDSVLANPTPVSSVGVVGVHDGNGPRADWNGPTDDNELIALGHKMKSADAMFGQKASFTDLFNRNLDALRAAYPDDSIVGFDESRADMALASHLCFLTGADTGRIERIMRMSALARSKWDDRDDYLVGRTIGEVVRKAGNVYNKGHGRVEVVPLPAVDEICDEAVKLKDTMEFRLRSLLGVEDVSALQVSAAVLHLIITGVFWSPTGRDIRMLSSSENLNQHKGSDGFKFIRAKFGSVVDMDQLDAAIKISAGVNALDEERFTKTVHAAVAAVVMDYLEYNNQRNAIRYSSDMFATRSIMRLDRDCVNIVYEHTPLVAGSDVHAAVDPRVIVDFKEHFSRLDDLLKFIAAARFARDRKKAYLWIHAPSDWGKGLIIGALQSLDCAVEVSMEDIERMLEGAPSGHSPESFKRKFVLSLNEVKSIKRELKEVERTLRMSPKFQMATTVDVYTKLLWSADNIPSLVGEEGVEDQLANRISVFKEEGCRLDDRPLAIEVGMPSYYDNVVYYIRDTLNALLDGYIAMGRAGAERAAQTYLNDFHAQYNIGKMYGVLSEALPAMANQLIADIKAIPFNEQMDAGVRHVGATNDWYITAPRKFVNDWIFKTYSRSEMAMHAPKVGELLKLISADGLGKSSPVRIDQTVTRLLKIK